MTRNLCKYFDFQNLIKKLVPYLIICMVKYKSWNEIKPVFLFLFSFFIKVKLVLVICQSHVTFGHFSWWLGVKISPYKAPQNFPVETLTNGSHFIAPWLCFIQLSINNLCQKYVQNTHTHKNGCQKLSPKRPHKITPTKFFLKIFLTHKRGLN